MTVNPEAKTGAEQPKSRIEVLEETVLSLIDKVETLAKGIDSLQKTAVKKSTQRFGAEHARKAVKDTQTGKVYPSLYKAGKELAAEFGLDPLNQQVWYQIQKKAPERFKILEATDPEAVAAFAKSDAELQAAVDAENARIAAEEAAKAKAEAAPPKKKGK
jgi:hypothetical protein